MYLRTLGYFLLGIVGLALIPMSAYGLLSLMGMVAMDYAMPLLGGILSVDNMLYLSSMGHFGLGGFIAATMAGCLTFVTLLALMAYGLGRELHKLGKRVRQRFGFAQE